MSEKNKAFKAMGKMPEMTSLKETTKTITEKGAFQPKTVAAKELAKKTAKATKDGKIAAAIRVADTSLSQYLKSKMKKEDVEKKSTGGDTKLSPKQMKIAKMAPPTDKITGADFKAMKANKGVMVKARGCKMGRSKPTRIT